MLRATRVLLAPVVKRSTGLVGIDVVPDARAVLIMLYERTLQEIKVIGGLMPAELAAIQTLTCRLNVMQVIPEHAEYRKVVEAFTNKRLAAVKKHEDVSLQPNLNVALVQSSRSSIFRRWRRWKTKSRMGKQRSLSSKQRPS